MATRSLSVRSVSAPPSPPAEVGYELGTPELFYTYPHNDDVPGYYAYPYKVADSMNGSLLVCFQQPQVIGGNPDRFGFVQEIGLDGSDMGVLDLFVEPIWYFATDGAGNRYWNDDHGTNRMYKNGSVLADLSAYSGDYSDITVGIAVKPDDGSIWYTDNDDHIYEVNSSGGGLTQYTLGGSHYLNGLVWANGRFYIADNYNGSFHTYEPGVGFASFTGPPITGFGRPRDVTYSPLTERLYFSTRTNSGSEYSITSIDPSDGSSGTVDFDGASFDGASVNALTYINGYLYLAAYDPAPFPAPPESEIWRIPFVSS